MIFNNKYLMKNNNININKYEQEIIIPSINKSTNNIIDINNMNSNDIQNMKVSLNKLRNICNVLKEKNTIIDGMLISTKKRKKVISQETLEKEAELLKIDNEINITFNQLFSDFIHNDNDKNIIVSKIKLLRDELTKRKYNEYLNKKIMIEQKEEKIQNELTNLSTEQLEIFNNEIFKKPENDDNDKVNMEIMKKHYEDIKKNDIYNQMLSEIRNSLYNEKYNYIQSMRLLDNKDMKLNQKFNSKIINESSNYFQPFSIENSSNKNDLTSFEKKKKRINHSMDNKHCLDNDISNSIIEQKYIYDNKNIRNKSFTGYNKAYKKKSRFNSKLFRANNIL